MEHRAWLLIKFMFVVRHICIRDRVWWWTTALKLASTWSHAHQALLQLGARFLRLHVCLILRNRSVCLGTLITSKNLFKRQSSLIFYNHLLCFLESRTMLSWPRWRLVALQRWYLTSSLKHDIPVEPPAPQLLRLAKQLWNHFFCVVCYIWSSCLNILLILLEWNFGARNCIK